MSSNSSRSRSCCCLLDDGEIGKIDGLQCSELTHFTHEGVEALPMLVAMKQQLPRVTLHREQCQYQGMPHRNSPELCYIFVHQNRL